MPPTAQDFPAPRAGRGGARPGGTGAAGGRAPHRPAQPRPARTAPRPAPHRRDARFCRDPDRWGGDGDCGRGRRGSERESAAAGGSCPVRRETRGACRGAKRTRTPGFLHLHEADTGAEARFCCRCGGPGALCSGADSARTEDSSRVRRSSADPSPLAEASAPGVRALAHRRAWAVVLACKPRGRTDTESEGLGRGLRGGQASSGSQWFRVIRAHTPPMPPVSASPQAGGQRPQPPEAC